MEPSEVRRGFIKCNIGCGLDTAPGYENLDNSPSLLVQQNPVLRAITNILERIFARHLYTRFPESVRRHDVNQGLPYASASVEVIYSSHMLEHLPRRQAEEFLCEAYRVLIPNGILRLALPDLERRAREYLGKLESERERQLNEMPADEFMRSTFLGIEERCRIRQPISMYRTILAREGHAWMWDAPTLAVLLQKIGFTDVKERGFRESCNPEVGVLDLDSRKDESFYVEARK